MSCNIHAWAEKRLFGGWRHIPMSNEPFTYVHWYGLYGFLAGVRNYHEVPPIAPQRGLPDDVSAYVRRDHADWSTDAHSTSWLTIAELAAFDYSLPMEDRRYTAQTGPRSFDGGATCEEGQGRITTFRKFLGENFFKELDRLRSLGVERVVFWFDN